jgi:uncharacterized protein (TIGR00369 family)
MTDENRNQAPRQRTVTWEDPAVHREALRAMGGKEFLTAIVKGSLPPSPIANLLGYRVSDVGDGVATVELSPGEHVCSPAGVLHGGVLCTLLDTAMACAIHTKLLPGQAYMTLGIDVRFARPVTPETVSVRAEGRILHLGASVATAEAKVVDVRGTLYAHAASTFAIVPGGKSTR